VPIFSSAATEAMARRIGSDVELLDAALRLMDGLPYDSAAAVKTYATRLAALVGFTDADPAGVDFTEIASDLLDE
jgi:hypothetical protein